MISVKEVKKVFFCLFFVFNDDISKGGVAFLDQQRNY